MNLYTLHLGIMPTPTNSRPSFLDWSSSRQELYLRGLQYKLGDDLDPHTFGVTISGSWEVWGVRDQQDHRSLHLEVEVEDADPVRLATLALCVRQYAKGRLADIACLTTVDNHSEKTHVVDLSTLPTVYVYEVPTRPTGYDETVDKALALDKVHETLDGHDEWSADTTRAIANILINTGCYGPGY